ncbi:hypothetical protein BZK41_23510 [Citrobacter sp. A316]|nr:hypothetical protein BZK41_23510 [Citrobacter sp. A316]
MMLSVNNSYQHLKRILHSIRFTAQVAGNAYPCCRLQTDSTSLHHQKPFVLFLTYITLIFAHAQKSKSFRKAS